MSNLETRILKWRKRGMSCTEVAKKVKSTPGHVRFTLYKHGATRQRNQKKVDLTDYIKIAKALEKRAKTIRAIAKKMGDVLVGL